MVRLRSTWLALVLAAGFSVSGGLVAVGAEAPASLGPSVNPTSWEKVSRSFPGKVTLFTFWGVHCEPCLREMPDLIRIYETYRDRNFEIVAINTDTEGEFEAAGRVVEKLSIPFKVHHKQPGSDTKFRQAIDPEYAANPFAVLVDPNGKKIRTFAEPHDEAGWKEILEPLLSGIPPETIGNEAADSAASPASLAAIDLSALVPDLAAPASGAGNAPANPFRLGRPKWEGKSPSTGVLSLPFTSDKPGHLLLASFQHQKLKGKGISLGDFEPSKHETFYMEIRDETEEVLYTPGSILIPVSWSSSGEGESVELGLLVTFQGCTDGKDGLCYPPDSHHLTVTLKSESGGLQLVSILAKRLDPFAPRPEPEMDESDPASSQRTGEGAASSGNSGQSQTTPPVEKQASVESSTPPPATTRSSLGVHPFGFDGDFGELAKRSLFLSFVVAFIGGILTSFTPCVYPMIPATVAIFGAKEVKSKAQALSLAATYIMGVALSYSSLGLLAAALGTVFGQAMENPWVISVVALFYVILALSMLDVFVFYLPSTWVTAATKVNRKGYTGAFLMGLVSSVVFAPCGEPILLSILLLVAQQKSFFLGFWWLFVYAWGIGLLFFVIAVFSNSIQYLPKAGVWMVAVKDFFGLLLFGLALYWISFVAPPIWVWCLATLYFLGVATFIHTKNEGLSGWSRPVLSFATLAALLLATLPLQRVAIHQGWLPAVGAVVGAVPSGGENPIGEGIESWRTGEPLALLRKARDLGKPAMLDFRTDVCPKCDYIEEHVFSDPRVLAALDGFVKIQVNLSEATEEVWQVQRENQVLTVPVIDFYDSAGNRLPHKRIKDELEAETFIEHIRDIG